MPQQRRFPGTSSADEQNLGVSLIRIRQGKKLLAQPRRVGSAGLNLVEERVHDDVRKATSGLLPSSSAPPGLITQDIVHLGHKLVSFRRIIRAEASAHFQPGLPL